jgi:hypothetical protein
MIFRSNTSHFIAQVNHALEQLWIHCILTLHILPPGNVIINLIELLGPVSPYCEILLSQKEVFFVMLWKLLLFSMVFVDISI